MCIVLCVRYVCVYTHVLKDTRVHLACRITGRCRRLGQA